jgi:superfamily II DNA or RNA helicase
MKRTDQSGPVLAGGIVVATVEEPSPIKRSRTASVGKLNSAASTIFDIAEDGLMPATKITNPNIQSSTKLKSVLQKSTADTIWPQPNSPLASTKLISTSSAKLTYLMQRIIAHHKTEKILVFYESENVAYYIAQALECLHIKHLIYAKTLPSDRKSQYVVTFNQTEAFRVLLMDITQAAFGLDMSSASRVYFVNPVFSPQVEAQAVKRAHRIGQTRPVYVETLILKGGIEEVILERRQDLSQEEFQKCKNILNDEKIYDWIRNVRFIPVSLDDVPGPDQMAILDAPEPIFGRSTGHTVGAIHDPDADLIMDAQIPGLNGKRKASVFLDVESSTSATDESTKSKKKKTVAFG